MTTTETQTYEPCTTEVQRRRHLSAELTAAPDPRNRGREGYALCGVWAMDQQRLLSWVVAGESVAVIEGLPLCGNCERLANKEGEN